jgi:hypothetical protein
LATDGLAFGFGVADRKDMRRLAPIADKREVGGDAWLGVEEAAGVTVTRGVETPRIFGLSSSPGDAIVLEEINGSTFLMGASAFRGPAFFGDF